MSRDDKAELEVALLQVCTERDLARIAKQVERWESVYMYLNVTGPETIAVKQNNPGDYEQQKLEVLKVWKHKRGFEATFKVLADVFSKELSDQTMVDTINTLATKASKEFSEDLVIEHLREFEQFGFDKLQAVMSSTQMITDAYSETLAGAANENKKLEVVFTMLSHMFRRQLAVFLKELRSEILQHVGQHKEGQQAQLPPIKAAAAEVDSETVAVSPSGARDNARTKLSNANKKFREAVKNIKLHLEHCDVQDLVTDFNMSASDIPYFSDEIKKQLQECGTIKDLFLRLSTYISWQKRDVLRVLVEVSDCKAAIDELDGFEEWLDTSQSIVNYPIPQASSSICPDPNSEITMVTMKANKDLKAVTYKDVEQYQDTVAQAGNVSSKALDLQATNPGSSILYWLLPKSVIKSFEENIRSNLDDLYDQGILEISLDPNIVITTGRKLRVRSLSYLTKLPPQDARPPQRAEELEELPTADVKLPERAEELVELAYQLKIDVQKREKENVELDVKVENLERDKEEKEQECNVLKEYLTETVKENENLKKRIIQDTFNIHTQQHVNLSFGVRGHTTVNCEGKIYIGGGVVSKNNGAPNIIQVIDSTTQQVSQLSPCPVKHFGLVSIDNQIVTVGGKTKIDDQVTNQLYCWNEATQQWEQSLPPMSTPRYFHTCVVWNNHLIVCGGRIDNEDSITDSVEILNLQSKRWHNASTLPLKESGKHAVITDNGKLYLLGGYLGNAVHYCKLRKLIDSTVTAAQPEEATIVWKRLDDTPCTDCAAVLLQGSLVVMGGRSYATMQISNKVFCYSNATDEWQHIGDLMYNRTGCLAIALNYSTVLVIGGTVLNNQRPEWFSASTEIVNSYGLHAQHFSSVLSLHIARYYT